MVTTASKRRSRKRGNYWWGGGRTENCVNILFGWLDL